jgi:hypothetical protein
MGFADALSILEGPPANGSADVAPPGGAAPQESSFSTALDILEGRVTPRAKETKPEIGTAGAALEGYLSGASLNWRDEIYGASKASGLPDFLGGFRAPIGAIRLAEEKNRGAGSALAARCWAAKINKPRAALPAW